MNYSPQERLRIAWRWLPLELLVVVLWILLGWAAAKVWGKPVYQVQTNIKVERRMPSDASLSERRKQRRKDVKNVGQFNVMPHQAGVLYATSEYAYTRYGIWQELQDLSESATAAPISGQPVFSVTVASSSKTIARENARAFQFGIMQTLKTLKHYRVTVAKPTIHRVENVMLKTTLKVFAASGLGLAVLAPYAAEALKRRGRDQSV